MSSRWKDLAKNGWHPEKEGTTFKGQMKSLVGRGDSSQDRSSHVAVPISSLRDPASFAPPPKRDPSAPIPPPTSSSYAPALPSSTRPGPPAPPARFEQQQSPGAAPQQESPMEAAPRPAPKKWQLDTTGLSTAHLPPPPGRRDGADGRSPVSAGTPVSASGTITKGPPPSLPPRLPPRSGTNSPVRTASPSLPSRSATHTPTPQPVATAESGFLNQGAASRLGAAGISVPGFGIGGNKTGPAPPPPRSPATSISPAPPPSQGTTWQQKQAALKTASQFHKDPSSVSFSDAKSAASTANNFRQRHGEQVAGGLRTANSLGQRFGVTPPAQQASAGPDATAGAYGQPASESAGSMSVRDLASAIGKKKPAPPPPRKKPDLSAGGTAGAPPPVPMSTRPTF
ncbi:hypothetical protein PFICI_12123 [Pestalotiopsis fici W106-1]|uniref:Gmp synthase n=1 Tax=Pestalotiopsis fici (strain W106-1 / CGMCC3.15140) TaxID=1229662 RepID=W3WV73_PESFW|nr:uncharacterized protein PFICI_12123 [Pestalotiopsis fici W106-1]ETS76736.1 hypothetical protein PFICI_12123 [Pestalotiopsis fici W106-1]